MDSIQLLTSDYLDGELTDDEAGRLARALETDSAALDRFVLDNFIHSQLVDWMDQQLVQDRAMSAVFADDEVRVEPISSPEANSVKGRSTEVSISARTDPAGAMGRRRRLRAWGALAATLLVAASISVVAYVVAMRPVFVGQLTDATGCRWGTSQIDIPVGTLLQEGRQLELVQGSAVITFASGAKLLLEGPASLRLDSETEVHLTSGRIAAKVPRQAIGFTVTSSLARFVDLGTMFTLRLVAEKSFELHVFEGLVEVQLDERFGDAARHPARIAEVTAVSFDVESGDVAKLHFEEGKQMPF